MRNKSAQRLLITALALLTIGAPPSPAQNTYQQEADRLAKFLQWRSGSVVAEIGAGAGQLTVIAANRVGPGGKVYSTELGPKKVAHLKDIAAKQPNITVVLAAVSDTNLPHHCCDSIFMRLVYHHLTDPKAIDASLFRALKSGGLLAVIDENPRKGTTIPPGVPKNRGGHGVPQRILIREMTASGFRVNHIDNNWPARDAYHDIYCVVFEKPRASR